MANLIKPNEVKIVTKEGEVQVTIVLELNINLNTGSIDGVQAQAIQKKAEKESDHWAIPDFQSEKINFGKKG